MSVHSRLTSALDSTAVPEPLRYSRLHELPVILRYIQQRNLRGSLQLHGVLGSGNSRTSSRSQCGLTSSMLNEERA